MRVLLSRSGMPAHAHGLLEEAGGALVQPVDDRIDALQPDAEVALQILPEGLQLPLDRSLGLAILRQQGRPLGGNGGVARRDADLRRRAD